MVKFVSQLPRFMFIQHIRLGTVLRLRRVLPRGGPLEMWERMCRIGKKAILFFLMVHPGTQTRFSESELHFPKNLLLTSAQGQEARYP